MNATGLKKYKAIPALLGLVLAISIAYLPVVNYGFINLDDTIYVTQNQYIQKGLSGNTLLWAFTSEGKPNTYWHPLTWISHLIDFQLFGLNAGMHHLISVLWHIFNSILLFLFFRQLGVSTSKSMFIGLLFGLHPICIDSVAWIAERKNVLSTFFWLLTMISYSRYIKKKTRSRYMTTLLCFFLGLMAKPILNVLPFALLLLDYWPFMRYKKDRLSVIIFEKLPFLLLACIPSFLSFYLNQNINLVISTDVIPVSLRIENMLVSYLKYLIKFAWPFNLSVFYPFPTHIDVWQWFGAGTILLVATGFTLINIKKLPYLFVGWFWFLGTLFPASGLVQGGLWPAMADRWAYIPFIGIIIMITFGIADILAVKAKNHTYLVCCSIVFISLLFCVTRIELRYWADSIHLFTHALKTTQANYIAHKHLGEALFEEHKIDQAISHYEKSLAIHPDQKDIQNNVGILYKNKGNYALAVKHYKKALALDPGYIDALNNLANILADHHDYQQATRYYLKALTLDNKNISLLNNLGSLLAQQNDLDGAEKYLHKALALDPHNAWTFYSFGKLEYLKSNYSKAIDYFKKALDLNQNDANVHRDLATVLAKTNHIASAFFHLNEALKIAPQDFTAQHNLDILLSDVKNRTIIIKDLQRKLSNNPDNTDLLMQLGNIRFKTGAYKQAILCYRSVLIHQPDNIKTRFNLARTYSMIENFDQSRQTYLSILKYNPTYAGSIFYNIACSYSRQNQFQQAANWLEKAIGKGFRDWGYLYQDHALENFRKSEYFKYLQQKYKIKP